MHIRISSPADGIAVLTLSQDDILPPPGEFVDRVILLYGRERDILFFSIRNVRGRLMDFILPSLWKRTDLEARG